MDLARYSKDEFKKVMGELVQYEEFITELSVNKSIRGGKLPARIYTIVIMEPDAINLKELAEMKKKSNEPQPTIRKPEVFPKDIVKEIIDEKVGEGVPKK